MGYTLADALTWGVSRQRNSAMGQAIRANMRLVLGDDANDQEVEQAVTGVFRNAGRAYYDLYHALGVGKEAVLSSVTFTPRAENYLEQYGRVGGGGVVVSAHVSNFDLAGLAFATRGIPIQALTWPNPTSGYDVQNEMRQSWGIDITPVSMSALRQALNRLRSGGLVITGIDRPDPTGSGDQLIFFDQTVYLPTGHVRLALQADVPIAVATVHNDPQRPHAYVVDVEPPLTLEIRETRAETIQHNAQRVLSLVETIIRANPEQWLMFYPMRRSQ
jgi:KDO2-lipid IV(A) lauroyltransferase